MTNDNVLFRVSELETLAFNDTLNAYHVEKLGQAMGLHYITPVSLLSHEIFHKWELNQKLYINIKYDLSDLCDDNC